MNDRIFAEFQMKRSISASLALMGAAPLFLVACGSDSQVKEDIAYDSEATCVADGNRAADCALAFNKAVEDAPKFATEEDCKTSFDGCQKVTDNNGNSWFMPMMMGYMLARTMGGGGAAAVGRPLYQSRGGALTEVSKVSNGGYSMRPHPGSVASMSNLSSVRSAANARTTRGFGGSSRISGG